MKPKERMGLLEGMRSQRFCNDVYEGKEREKFGTHSVKGNEENSCVRFQRKEGIRGV